MFSTPTLVLPLVDHRVFEVEHDAGRAGVEHLHDQLGIVRRTGHLVALILAPLRQLDPPVAPHRVPGKAVYRLFPRWDSARISLRSPINARCQGVKRRCSGSRNSRKPLGSLGQDQTWQAGDLLENLPSLQSLLELWPY